MQKSAMVRHSQLHLPFAAGTWLKVSGFLALTLALLGSAASCRRNDSKAPVVDGPEVAHGRELYARMCSVCHGAAGEGYKADQAPRLAQPDFLASASDEFLRTAIIDGRSNTTMSAWGNQKGGPLTPTDVTALVKFLRTWQRGPTAKLDERALAGDAARGATLFAEQCQSCHGARGVGGPNVHIGGPELLASASNGFLRHAIVRGRPGTIMPAFAALGSEKVDDLIAALRSWQSPVVALQPPARVPPIPLGPVPLNPKGPEPQGFKAHPQMTSVDVVHAELARGARLAILDARAPSDYAREHIAGAVSVPFYDPAPYFDGLPKDTWLVCYCACPHAESGQLAQKLQAQGFKKVTVLDEGLGVWKARKYPINSPQGAGNAPHSPHAH
jgi:cytochrome c oxidase cbb3-type subunit 3/ubiquinol-cytochrome c reductase cytochrome c subunit